MHILIHLCNGIMNEKKKNKLIYTYYAIIRLSSAVGNGVVIVSVKFTQNLKNFVVVCGFMIIIDTD